jgi:arginyl-tRNA synthetase
MIIIKEQIRKSINLAVKTLIETGYFPEEVNPVSILLSPPKFKEHGDLSTNFALATAKKAKKSPREIATKIVEILGTEKELFQSVEVAGPGFINFSIAPSALFDGLGRLLASGSAWGSGDQKSQRINLEFVSANPTGPLHVGHGRGAAIGDALAKIMSFAGYSVSTEYYLNDAGRQVDTLATSIWSRYIDICREEDSSIEESPLAEDGYRGEYVKDMAKSYFTLHGIENAKNELDLTEMIKFGISQSVETIKKTLAKMGVEFDLFFSEKSLHKSGALKKSEEILKEKGMLYLKDGATFFKSSNYGDEKDRVMIRANGVPTYFAADIAYHLNKLERGFDTLIDIWGADHHGYVPRVKASMEAFGKSPDDFQALLVQFVSLVSSGEKLAMGKRSGNFVTLDELIDQVGADVTRWFFLSKSHDSPLDFDMEKALSADPRENPARYAQYGHARACSILDKASKEYTITIPQFSQELAKRLEAEEELDLIKLMLQFPEVIADSASSRATNRVANYLVDISRMFHSYYSKFRNDAILPKSSMIVDGWRDSWDIEKSEARLMWVDAFRIVTSNALSLLGLPAPRRMDAPKEEI